jgi:hypothetical protein
MPVISVPLFAASLPPVPLRLALVEHSPHSAPRTETISSRSRQPTSLSTTLYQNSGPPRTIGVLGPKSLIPSPWSPVPGPQGPGITLSLPPVC